MAHCLISNWKGKKVRKHYTKTKFERKIRATFSTDSLSSPTPLSSSFFLVSLRTCIHGYQQEMESCCCVDSLPFRREKRWERCGTRRGIVCCAFRRKWGRRARRRLFSRLLTTRKETKTLMLQHKKKKKKKIPTHLFVFVFRRVVGFLPTVRGRWKRTVHNQP